MRLYLDTNILVFMLRRKEDDIDYETRNVIYDCANQLHTSVLCVGELMQLEMRRQKKQKYKKTNYGTIIEWLKYNNIDIKYITEKHLQTYADLPLFDDHRDVIDRMIIAQAISDKATLISSDLKFSLYCGHGLVLHTDKR